MFDGSGAPGVERSVLVREGRVEALLAPGEAAPTDALRIDCAGKWVEPGPLSDQDGNDIRTGHLSSHYNVTADDWGKIIVVNEVANL